jgi:hypothetical protein
MPLPVFTTFYTGQTDYVEKLNGMVANINSLSGDIDQGITDAQASASAAAASAASASSSAVTATSQATAASTQASSAAASATLAANYANYNVGSYVPGTTDYSSKHWAYMGLNIKFKGGWNNTSYPTSPTQGDRWVITANVTISGTPYLAGESIVYNGATWDKIPITDSSIPALVSGQVLTNNGSTMNWTSSLTNFTITTPTVSNPTISGTITLSSAPTLTGKIWANDFSIVGNSTGNDNIAYIGFYESNKTTRKGYVGDTESGNSDIYVGADVGNVYIWEQGGVVSGRAWHAGNDGTGSGLDADLWDGNQFATYLNQPVLTTSTVTFGNISTAANAYVGIGTAATIRDIATVDTVRVQGTTDPTKGYIVFGNSNTAALGRAGTGALTYNGYTVWHAGNDGSGSGLDADLLDGAHADVTAAVSTLAKRGTSGQLTAAYFVSNAADSNITPTKFYASDDTTIKSVTAANFKKGVERGSFTDISNGGTLEINKRHSVSTSGGVATIYLPAKSSVAEGDQVEICNRNLTWLANNLTVAKQGGDTGVFIQGLEESLLCDIELGVLRLVVVEHTGAEVYWNIA